MQDHDQHLDVIFLKASGYSHNSLLSRLILITINLYCLLFYWFHGRLWHYYPEVC